MPTQRPLSSPAGRRARSGSRRAGSLRVLPGQLAVRARPDATTRVLSALGSLGEIEPYPGRVFVLHYRPQSGAKARKVLAALESADLIEFVTPVLRDAASGTRQILTDEITVRLRPKTPIKGTLNELRSKEGVSVAERNEFVPKQFIVKVAHPSGTRTLEVARRLDARDDIEFAAPNYITEIKR